MIRMQWSPGWLRLLKAASLAYVLWAAARCGAQPPTDLRHLVLRTWTAEQGLPQDFITAIAQTGDGFLWVGTQSGLARFDGVRFRTFEQDAPPGIRRGITDLAVDSQGTLWIGSTAGLFAFDNGEFHPILLQATSSEPVQQLLPVRDGCCIQVRTSAGFYHVDSSRRVRRLTLPLDAGKMDHCTVDLSATLWCADGQRVLSVVEGKAVSHTLPHAAMAYTAPDGRVYASDWHHLYLFSQGRFIRLSEPQPEEFVRVLMDTHGQVWFACGGLQGIARRRNGKLEFLDTRFGLISNDARVLFEDRSGDIWIGTISGLQQLHRGAFLSYSDRDGLPAGSVQYDTIFEDHAGTVWAGTLEHGAVALSDGRWRPLGLQQGIPKGQIRGFADDRGKPVVAVSDYGLFAASVTRYRKLRRIPSGYIASPIRTQDGSLWFSVLHKGVYRLKDGKLDSYSAREGLTDTAVWALTATSDGFIWAGGASGLFRFEGERWIRVYASHAQVDAVAPAQDGGIFLGTAAGLVRLSASGTVLWSMRQENGLPSDSVFAVEQDDQHNLWLATARGICLVPAGQVDQFSRGSRLRIFPELFTRDDGLRTRSVLPMGQVTALRSRNGQIWFATASGPAVALQPYRKELVPQAVVDRVTVDEHLVRSGPLTIPPGRHRVVVSFTAPVFIAPEQISFRYRLAGWDSDWVVAEGGVREAVYQGLPPGKYSFAVQAVGRSGDNGPISLSLPIALQPHFWQTRSFLIFVILAGIASIVEITRRRTLHRAERLNLRFQERASERERIASEIHDTLIQDLTGTALQMELVDMRIDDEPLEARQSLREVAVRVREMIARSREMVSNLHTLAGTDSSLLDLLRNVESEFRLYDIPRYSLRESGKECSLHPLLRDEVYRICREAVANAFRHARAQSIDVTVHFGRDTLHVVIYDDGVGMDDQTRTHGRAGHFGLSGMQTHARRIGATLTVESAPDKGTKVAVTAPLRGPWPGRLRQMRWRQS